MPPSPPVGVVDDAWVTARPALTGEAAICVRGAAVTRVISATEMPPLAGPASPRYLRAASWNQAMSASDTWRSGGRGGGGGGAGGGGAGREAAPVSMNGASTRADQDAPPLSRQAAAPRSAGESVTRMLGATSAPSASPARATALERAPVAVPPGDDADLAAGPAPPGRSTGKTAQAAAARARADSPAFPLDAAAAERLARASARAARADGASGRVSGLSPSDT